MSNIRDYQSIGKQSGASCLIIWGCCLLPGDLNASLPWSGASGAFQMPPQCQSWAGVYRRTPRALFYPLLIQADNKQGEKIMALFSNKSSSPKQTRQFIFKEVIFSKWAPPGWGQKCKVFIKGSHESDVLNFIVNSYRRWRSNNLSPYGSATETPPWKEISEKSPLPFAWMVL